MTSVAETQPRPASTAKSRDGWLEFFETSSSACNLEESDRKAAALCLKDIKKDLLMSWGDTAYDKVVHKALEPLDVHVVVTIKQDLTGLREDYASRPGKRKANGGSRKSKNTRSDHHNKVNAWLQHHGEAHALTDDKCKDMTFAKWRTANIQDVNVMIETMKKKTPSFDWERTVLMSKIEKRFTYISKGGKNQNAYKVAKQRRVAKKAKPSPQHTEDDKSDAEELVEMNAAATAEKAGQKEVTDANVEVTPAPAAADIAE